MTSSTAQPPTFRFLELPGEVRNMVYRYLLVAPSDSTYQLALNRSPTYRIGFDTSILSVNKQIYAEASSTLYSANRPLITAMSRFAPHQVFRKDKTNLTTRTLRSGRRYSMSQHSGRIYHHVLARFARIKVESYAYFYANDPNTELQWTTSIDPLRYFLTELCKHKNDEVWSCHRELVIAMTFSYLTDKVIDVAALARRFHETMEAYETKKLLKELLKDYVIKLEGEGPLGLMDSLIEEFKRGAGEVKLQRDEDQQVQVFCTN